jgi:CRP/FNR family transcriptional regulator
MYVILNGKVKVVQTTEDGKEILLALHQSGDFFGEMSLIDGKTSPANVIATEDSTAAIISKKDFNSLIRNQKKVLDNLLLILCSRYRESWDKIQMLNYKNASHRIKILFLMLSDKYGEKTAEGITINMKLTHQEIADMTGMTRETVTRVIDRWQREGEINILKNKFIHLSPIFLQKDLKLSVD